MTNEEYKVKFSEILFKSGFYLFLPRDIQEKTLEIAEESALEMIDQTSNILGIPRKEIEDHCRSLILLRLLNHALDYADFSYEEIMDSAWN